MGACSGPDIGMDGSKGDQRAPRITVKPTACVSQSRRFVIVIPVMLVDAILESAPAVEGRLHREAQSIRLIAVFLRPSPRTWARLDEMGQGHPPPDGSVFQVAENSARQIGRAWSRDRW